MRIKINGKALRALRLQRGETQEELARRVGCALRTISAIERGESGGAGLRRDLAAALGVEPEMISLEAP